MSTAYIVRNVRLTRSSLQFTSLGKQCNQSSWQAPSITSKDPGKSGNLIKFGGPFFFLKTNWNCINQSKKFKVRLFKIHQQRLCFDVHVGRVKKIIRLLFSKQGSDLDVLVFNILSLLRFNKQQKFAYQKNRYFTWIQKLEQLQEILKQLLDFDLTEDERQNANHTYHGRVCTSLKNMNWNHV